MKKFFFLAVLVFGLIIVDFNFSIISRIDSAVQLSRAVRNYTINLALSAEQHYPYNVPSFAAVNVMKELNVLSSNINYREVSNNPINPSNISNEIEEALIKKNEFKSVKYDFSLMNNRAYIVQYEPVYMDKRCLQCHGELPNFSEVHYKYYGNSGGYNFKENELYGLKVISIDITLVLIKYLMFVVLFFFPSVLIIQHFEKKLKNAMIIDSLSGAFNKNYFLKVKDSFTHGFLIIIDIDNFKKINDNHGHSCGDLVIKELCDVIRNECHARDMLFRFGGEEFVIFAENTDCKKSITSLIEKIIEGVRCYKFGEEKQLAVTVSIGACHKKLEQNINNVITLADEVMYSVKKNGKDNYIISD